MTIKQIQALSREELAREIAHARNKRDAFAEGREPRTVMANLRRLLAEQAMRRGAAV